MMKKIYYNLIFGSIIAVYLFLFNLQVNASGIEKIDMDVYIDKNGNATVTETWNANLNQGTEGYRTYTNLSNATISNFVVSDETGRTYESLSSWDTSESFDNKAYKSGLHYISDGVELCWGISNYGNKTYTLKYNINNFVNQYTDTQGIYFNFLDLDQYVSGAKITIHSDFSFSLDNARIWAFGNNGTINFEDGKIVLDSGGSLSSSQYMVALIRFQSNIFSTNNKVSKTFDNEYDSAMRDVDDSSYKEDNTIKDFKKIGMKGILLIIVFLPLYILSSPLTWIIFIIILVKVKGKNWLLGSRKRSGTLVFGPSGKTLPTDDQINYWREIPCNKDLERAYWVCFQYNVVSSSTLEQGIIGAILLKWIQKKYITVSKTKAGLFSLKDNNYAIDLTNMKNADNEIEDQLFKMLISAAGHNKILESKEFKKWSKKNYSKVNEWFSTIVDKETTYLEKQGLIKETTEEVDAMFGRKKTITIKNVDSNLKEEAIQLKGLKKFLLDFSMMPEREYFEVHVWEEYLIFAQLMGIADKVSEQFSKLYPKFNQESLLTTDVTTIAIMNMSEMCYEGVQEGIAKAIERDYSGSSRDSGGGGDSYSSGGSSSGGSSGGGFR